MVCVNTTLGARNLALMTAVNELVRAGTERERVARLANMQQCVAHKGEMMACVVKADCVKFDVVSRRAADLGTIKTLDARCELMEQECQAKLSAMEAKMVNDWAILAAYREMTEEWGHQIEIDKNCVDL
jgi:uncharacterized protein (UPF0179 family)